jgi:hypothetical protein
MPEINAISFIIIYSGIFSSTFLLPVYGSKYSIFNWVLKLNVPPQWFSFTIWFFFNVNVPLKTCFSIQFCLKSCRKLFHFWDTKSCRGILVPMHTRNAYHKRGLDRDNTSRNEIRPLFALVKLAPPSHKHYYQKKVIELQRAITYYFFIFVKIRLLAVEWHVFHAKWRKNKQVRVR